MRAVPQLENHVLAEAPQKSMALAWVLMQDCHKMSMKLALNTILFGTSSLSSQGIKE
jgi:hypothetical protein